MKKITFILLLLAFHLSFGQQYVNGNIITGTVTNSGVVAPAGYSWSENQNNTGDFTVSNARNPSVLERALANDFVVPTGETWNINSFEMFTAQLSINTTQLVGILNIEIWDGDPTLSSSTKIYGDQVTNTLDVANSTRQNIYVIPNTNFNFPCPTTSTLSTFSVWKLRGNVNVSLNTGTYWVVFYCLPASTTGYVPYSFHSRSVGARSVIINSPSKIKPYVGNWFTAYDDGCPTASYVPQELPFNINYTLNMGVGDVYLSDFKVYPNPAEQVVNIQWNSHSNGGFVSKVILTDIRGVKVIEKNLDSDTISNIEINVDPLQKGIYLLSVFDDSNNVLKTTKIVKQ